jgi:transcriptional regulator
MESLRGDILTARDISARLSLREKDVYHHLEHIRHSIHGKGETLQVTAAECRTCGFVFAKRERLTPPGKCPLCRGEAISDPLFQIIG